MIAVLLSAISMAVGYCLFILAGMIHDIHHGHPGAPRLRKKE
jgi:hypothetical protein